MSKSGESFPRYGESDTHFKDFG